MWPSRRDVPPGNWTEWLGSAKKNCTLLGVAHGEWRNDERFEPALKQCLTRRNVHVHILFLDPNSELAASRAKEEQRDTSATIRASIKIIWNEIRPQLGADSGRLHLCVYNSTPSSGATWIDDYMIVTHYLAGYPNRTSPAFKVQDLGQDSLYDVFRMNIEKIREKPTTIEITEENIEKYV
jgi:hypothetical protein